MNGKRKNPAGSREHRKGLAALAVWLLLMALIIAGIVWIGRSYEPPSGQTAAQEEDLCTS